MGKHAAHAVNQLSTHTFSSDLGLRRGSVLARTIIGCWQPTPQHYKPNGTTALSRCRGDGGRGLPVNIRVCLYSMFLAAAYLPCSSLLARLRAGLFISRVR